MGTLSRRLIFVVVLAALISLAATPVLAAPTPAAGDAGSAQAQGGTVAIVNVAWLNVRGGPGTGYRILTHAVSGQALDVQGQDSAGGWLQVHTPDGYDGWVSAQFVTLSAPTSADGGLVPYRIVAPAIGLDARVVAAGWHYVTNADGSVGAEWDVPSYAAGWLITTAHPGEIGNMVLSGHHNIEGQVFRYVVNLKVGDQITIYAGDRAFNYTVSQTMILPDKYVSYEQRLQNAKWIGSFGDERLTLVTCWPYTNNTHRVIVVAKPSGGH